jgi:hypothetical protein
METTKNKLTPYESNFFDKMRNYLDTKIYFYGSVQREDYFSGKSDIDVDIFTENMNSTITKMQNLLNVNRNNFIKVVIKPLNKNGIINGYKLKYAEPENNLHVEFSIYDSKYKDEILYEHNRKTKLPFIISILLSTIKYLYYNIGIIPKTIYLKIKNFLINLVDYGGYKNFVSIDDYKNI